MDDPSSNPTATLKDLSTALHSTLKYRGVLDTLTSSVRAEVFHCLDQSGGAEPPAMPNENLALNTLILEYLDFNNYSHAASVLRAESGMPEEGVDLEVIGQDMGVGSGGEVPLLYGIVEVLKSNKRGEGKKLAPVESGGRERERRRGGKEQKFRPDDASDGESGGEAEREPTKPGRLMRLGDPKPFIVGGY